MKQVQYKTVALSFHRRDTTFAEGEKAWSCDYRVNKPKWQLGTVSTRHRNSYTIALAGGNVTRRHQAQLRAAATPFSTVLAPERQAKASLSKRKPQRESIFSPRTIGNSPEIHPAAVDPRRLFSTPEDSNQRQIFPALPTIGVGEPAGEAEAAVEQQQSSCSGIVAAPEVVQRPIRKRQAPRRLNL